MRGHIVKRYPNSNSYSFVLELGKQPDPVTGKLRRKQKWITVNGTKKEAEKQYIRMQHELDTGIFIVPGKTTVSDYLESWLKDYCWPNLAPRSAEGYEYVVRHYISPAIGQIALTALKPEQVQRFYTDKLGSGLSNRTVRYCHVTLHKAFHNALKMGMIGRNPCDATEPPKVQRREMSTMNENDINIFLLYAKDTPYFPLFFTALYTGLRRSELLAVRWVDVDLILCQLSVTRTIHQLRYGDHKGQVVYKEPKSAKSRRMVALTPNNVAVLREYREVQDKQRLSLMLPVIKDDDLVFCNSDGSPYLPDGITHAWHKLAATTGLKGIRLHDARHTHASLLLKQNVHPKVVQERLGHSSIQITLDTYSHVAPGMQQAAANRFDEIISPRQIEVGKN